MRFFRLPLFVLPSTGLPTSNTFLEEQGGIAGAGGGVGGVGGGGVTPVNCWWGCSTQFSKS